MQMKRRRSSGAGSTFYRPKANSSNSSPYRMTKSRTARSEDAKARHAIHHGRTESMEREPALNSAGSCSSSLLPTSESASRQDA